MDSTEHDDLDNLIKAPGWLRFVEHVRAEWRHGYPAKVKLAIQQARMEKRDLGEAVAAVDSASDEVNKMLSWPTERLGKYALQAPVDSLSRRGGL